MADVVKISEMPHDIADFLFKNSTNRLLMVLFSQHRAHHQSIEPQNSADDANNKQETGPKNRGK